MNAINGNQVFASTVK